MLPGKHGLSFQNGVTTSVNSWDNAPAEKPPRRPDEDDNAKPQYARKTTQNSAPHEPPSVRPSVRPSVCLSLTKGLLGAVGAELLEYGPPVCLLGTVLLVILLKELGHLNVKY